MNESKAEKEFYKKVKSKLKKGYTEIKMALGKKSEAIKPQVEISVKDSSPSKLDNNVQDFIKLIFNKKLMEESVVKIGYDVKKLPLGDLSKETVLKGYQILRSIENVLAGNSNESLSDLSSEFYTHIPHNFGMAKMFKFIINTSEKVKEKLDLIQNLIDIQVACDIGKEPAKTSVAALTVNLIDNNYAQLKCKITTLNESESDF